MYIEIIKKTQGDKIYKTVLIRESYRENGKVKHRTIANISKLPNEYIRNLKAQMKGVGGEFNLSDLKNGASYEYGASFALKSLAKQIGLEQFISSQKTQWREDVIAMITGRVIYQGSKLSLVNTFKDSALWELAGHTYGVRPNVEKNCYQAMDKLLERKNRIERKIAKKHLKDGCIILYDITNFWLEGECENSELANYGKPKGGKIGYKQIAIGLLTNSDGCYAIKTDADKNLIDKNETVDAYRNLQKVEQAFKNMKTVLLELRPVYHKSDDRIKAHVFIVSLAYYLQWHANQKLKPLFDNDGVGENKRWSFEGVISRLKSIQKVENLINNEVVKTNISEPDSEQAEILNLLGVELM